MTERPIIFSGPMVWAILDGRKTQTRRLLKVPRGVDPNHWDFQYPEGSPGLRDQAAQGAVNIIHWPLDSAEHAVIRCPYGQPGDRLWVRETWALGIPIGASYRAKKIPVYAADGETFPRWRPSIYMPRWASRITLEITATRVERLQDIGEADARAEGVAKATAYEFDTLDGPSSYATHRAGFIGLWKSIHGSKSWDTNPLVWVVEFKRC